MRFRTPLLATLFNLSLSLSLACSLLSWGQSAPSANPAAQRKPLDARSLLHLVRPDRNAAPRAANSPVPASAKTYKFTSVDYPGAFLSEVTDSTGTTDVGVAESGVGTSTVFSFSRTGNKYAIIAAPNSLGTQVLGINSLGVIVGVYSDLFGNAHGFVDNAGVFTDVDFPGAVGTLAAGINDAGDIVGLWQDGTTSHGFLDKGGIFTSVDFPGATFTQLTGINASDVVAGAYGDGANTHGIIWNNGAFTVLDAPGATSTTAFGINDSGEVAGFFEDAALVTHGMIYANSFSTVDLAGTISTQLTRITNKEHIAGIYADAMMEDHGVVAH